jgi:signal transduction histidine kinase
MKKVIDHLFSNSLEHGFQEQETPKIMVTVEVNGDHIEIIYQDNGKGLTKSEANKVFDPFYTTKMGSDNVGLGLSVTYNLITQLMQGSITCDASNDGIALFKITLPITTNSIT